MAHQRCRKLVRILLCNAGDEVFRVRGSSLAPWPVSLEAEWARSCRNGAELWRRLRGRGFDGGLRVVGEWATRRRRSGRADGAIAGRLPPARTTGRAMLTGREHLRRGGAVVVSAIERALPPLAEARDLVDERFHRVIQGRAPAASTAWVAAATASMLAPFGRNIAAQSAVLAALGESWSNGPTKGLLAGLKLIRRQMYGRSEFDLLRARLVAPA